MYRYREAGEEEIEKEIEDGLNELERVIIAREEPPDVKGGWRIKEEVLDLIIELARSYYPEEFSGNLLAKEGMIYELDLFLPTLITDGSADGYAPYAIQQAMPHSKYFIGMVHSHSTESLEPTNIEFALSHRFGGFFIVMAYPFNKDTWKAYSPDGEEMEIEVV